MPLKPHEGVCHRCHLIIVATDFTNGRVQYLAEKSYHARNEVDCYYKTVQEVMNHAENQLSTEMRQLQNTYARRV